MTFNALNKIRRHIFMVFLFFLLGAFQTQNATELPPLTSGLTAVDGKKNAPPLTLKDLDNQEWSLIDAKGKVVVVNFWATWCPPCRREMPSLERLYQQTKTDDVVVVAVNVAEDIETVFSFMGSIEPQPSFPILFDLKAQAVENWKVRGLPTTFIIAPDGTVAYHAVGGREFDHPELIKQLLELKK